jgi:DNA-binding response OmpR family regulator
MSKVLIIEDNADIAELYAAAFADHQTVVLNDVPQALLFLSRYKPDLVVTDFHLPNGTGSDIISHMRRHNALMDVPILGISVDDTVRDLVLEQGASAFMTKPIDIGELLSMARKLLSTPLETARTPAIPPETVLAGYLEAYEAAYHRRPDCYWTGRFFLIDRQRCDQAWLLSETERLRAMSQKTAAPRHALMRLIDKLRRI